MLCWISYGRESKYTRITLVDLTMHQIRLATGLPRPIGSIEYRVTVFVPLDKIDHFGDVSHNINSTN